jgi:uncharacterized protein (TIGR03067 family)
MRSLVVGVALLAVSGGPPADPPSEPVADRVARLVRQLGDKNYAKREAASKELDAIGEPARDALTKAVAGGDAEVGRRARTVLDSLDVRARAAAAKADLAKLQGTWYAVLVQYQGTNLGEDRTDTITYEGTRYVQRKGGYVFAEGTFEIVDATARPKRIDYVLTAGASKGFQVRGIYTLDGEDHAICTIQVPAGPPAEFSGKAGFYRLTRREKAPPRPPESRFDSAVFSTDLVLPESKAAVHRVGLVCRLADGEAGTLTLDPTAPAFDRFGDPAPGKPAPAVTVDVTLKLVKSEVGRNLFELRGPKLTSRLALVATQAGGGRLLVLDAGGDVRRVIDLRLPDPPLPPPVPPCHPGCFPAGTAIRTPAGTTPIEKLGEGDLVTSVGADGKAVPAKVTGVFRTRNRLLELRVEGDKLVTTETQPVALEAGGFRAAGELKKGDRVWRWVDGKRKAAAVTEVTAADRQAPVFNLILGDATGFVAGGFVVRSKPPAPDPRP